MSSRLPRSHVCSQPDISGLDQSRKSFSFRPTAGVITDHMVSVLFTVSAVSVNQVFLEIFFTTWIKSNDDIMSHHAFQVRSQTSRKTLRQQRFLWAATWTFRFITASCYGNTPSGHSSWSRRSSWSVWSSDVPHENVVLMKCWRMFHGSSRLWPHRRRTFTVKRVTSVIFWNWLKDFDSVILSSTQLHFAVFLFCVLLHGNDHVVRSLSAAAGRPGGVWVRNPEHQPEVPEPQRWNGPSVRIRGIQTTTRRRR